MLFSFDQYYMMINTLWKSQLARTYTKHKHSSDEKRQFIFLSPAMYYTPHTTLYVRRQDEQEADGVWSPPPIYPHTLTSKADNNVSSL